MSTILLEKLDAYFSVRTSIAILILIGIGIYIWSLGNEFVFDDRNQIVVNQTVHDIAYIPDLFFEGSFFSGGATSAKGGFYRPLMSSLFAIVYSLTGSTPMGFHVVQAILHVANSILLYMLLKRYFRSFISFFLAAVFLAHPINVETVAYISNTQDVLLLFFGLLSVYLVAIQKERIGYHRVLLSVLLMLSMLSKETGVVFILLIASYVYLFDRKALQYYLAPMVLVLGIYLYLRNVAVGLVHGTNPAVPIAAASLPERLLNVPKILIHYFGTYVWPVDLNVFAIWMVERVTSVEFIIPCFALLALLYLGWKLKSRFTGEGKKAYLFFSWWFLVGLLPHLHIVPLDMTVADRWFYVPQVGLLGIVGLLISKLFEQLKHISFFTIAVLSLMLLALSLRSVDRIFDWQDELTLTARDLASAPDNHMLEHALGFNLMNEGRHEEALIHLRRAIALYPEWSYPWNTLGYTYELMDNEASDKKAYEAYYRALELQKHYLTYANLANLLIEDERYGEAIRLLEEGMARYPNNPQLLYFYVYANKEVGNYIMAQQAVRNLYQLAPTRENLRLLESL